MGYELNAVIGAAEALRRVAGEFRAAQVVELEQGLAMVPMTEALFDEAVDRAADGKQEAALGFWFLPGGWRTVRTASVTSWRPVRTSEPARSRWPSTASGGAPTSRAAAADSISMPVS